VSGSEHTKNRSSEKKICPLPDEQLPTNQKRRNINATNSAMANFSLQREEPE
jgi:hypothetical protein